MLGQFDHITQIATPAIVVAVDGGRDTDVTPEQSDIPKNLIEEPLLGFRHLGPEFFRPVEQAALTRPCGGHGLEEVNAVIDTRQWHQTNDGIQTIRFAECVWPIDPRQRALGDPLILTGADPGQGGLEGLTLDGRDMLSGELAIDFVACFQHPYDIVKEFAIAKTDVGLFKGNDFRHDAPPVGQRDVVRMECRFGGRPPPWFW